MRVAFDNYCLFAVPELAKVPPPAGRLRPGERYEKVGTEPIFLNAIEASRVIGVSVAKIHSWAAARDAGEHVEAPVHYRVSDRKRLWSRADLLEWLETRRVR